MKQTIKLTDFNVISGEIEIEITQEMARKVLEENEEIEDGEDYWYRGIGGDDTGGTFTNDESMGTFQNYLKQQDNFLPCRKYKSIYKAKEYFDKRDARRAAEHRIKKAIEKMNGDKGRDSSIQYNHSTEGVYVDTDSVHQSQPKHLHFDRAIGDYMLKHHTEDYKTYWGIE